MMRERSEHQFAGKDPFLEHELICRRARSTGVGYIRGAGISQVLTPDDQAVGSNPDAGVRIDRHVRAMIEVE